MRLAASVPGPLRVEPTPVVADHGCSEVVFDCHVHPLMTHLEKKLQEVSEQMSKSTVDLVALQEKLMVARVQFQSGVADLTLEKPNAKDAQASN